MKTFTIAGHLGRTPELKSKDKKDGTVHWINLWVAVNGKDETDWFSVTAFGKLAHALATLEKGDGVTLFGELRSKEYDDRRQVDLVAYRATFFRLGKNKTTRTVEQVEGDDSDVPF